MAIFQFFKMAAAAILNFKNFKFLTVETVKRVKMQQCAKFRQNRCNRGRDMVFLDFSRLRPPTSWIFEIAKICSLYSVHTVNGDRSKTQNYKKQC